MGDLAKLQHARPVTLAEVAPEERPVLELSALGIAGMLDSPPPERRWLLADVLPLGVVGLLAAGGGTGKSYLTIQLAISVVAGVPFLGLEVKEQGAALILAAEDETDEIHRRLWRIVQQYRQDGLLDEGRLELLRERLFIASRVGVDNRLTIESGGEVIRTGMTKKLINTIEELPRVVLLVLDPVSRFRSGDENDNDAATRFVEAVETLRAATGATVLLPHHVSKAGLSAGAERLSVEGLRGASALVDGVRWAGAMATLRKDAAKDYGIKEEDAGRFVRLDVVKNNYAAPWPGMWLERGPGGVLIPTKLEARRDHDRQRKGDERYRELLPKLQGLIRQHAEQGDPLTRRKLRDYAGVAGMFGVGDQTLRGIVERAIAEGEIKAHPINDGKGEELRLW